ncbi:hypothetical protein H5S09_03815 [Limosilactobacillus sp. STM2_1]|uniref:Uncharacterized protein n=1 Tax=Limosilactobacillus rudii TaxID=2759755 RepID=A0A7W3YM45_9LACO|nr:hypothetical protein [Limosilactobacillus rudii]MBB1079046.1 hypothetical protein [Limosilactobacillus rudii]MBB1097079.1 hypothetical protein [Limosilactobacillus rudii]MCD7134046.1 hypothetical protein [Limosilactobacillus rudii]
MTEQQKKRRGRPRKYATKEEAKQAQLQQIKEANKKSPKSNYYQYKSKARNFITKKSTKADLIELQELINKRLEELSKN